VTCFPAKRHSAPANKLHVKAANPLLDSPDVSNIHLTMGTVLSIYTHSGDREYIYNMLKVRTLWLYQDRGSLMRSRSMTLITKHLQFGNSGTILSNIKWAGMQRLKYQEYQGRVDPLPNWQSPTNLGQRSFMHPELQNRL
jgi:hypothetical protein